MSWDTREEQLAGIEAYDVWEPGVPWGDATEAQGSYQHLLWGFFTPVYTLPPGINDYNLALMEWCQVWEPAIPMTADGSADQRDQQHLLWGPREPLWMPPIEPEGGVGPRVFRRRRRW